MATGYYLLDHPNPNRKQYLERRRASPTGAIVIHTPEAGVDLKLPDSKALDVYRFIASRNSYGSYHAIVDSDSIELGAPWHYEVWGSGPRSPHRGDNGTDGQRVRSNSIAIHLSIACNHDQWKTLPNVWVEAAVHRLALVASNAAQWLKSEYGIDVPATFKPLDRFWAKEPGFYDHATIDPSRRKDPGKTFPRDMFLDEFRRAMGNTGGGGGGGSTDYVKRIKDVGRQWGYTMSDGPNLDNATAAMVESLGISITKRMQERDQARAERDQARADLAEAVERAAALEDELQAAQDASLSLRVFAGRMAPTLHRLDQLQTQQTELLGQTADLIQTAKTWLDEVNR